MLPLKIVATAHVTPAREVSSQSLDEQLGHRPGFVASHSGVRRRFFATPDESQAELGAKALLLAAEEAGWRARPPDLLLVAGAPTQALPATACHIMELAGWRGLPAFDVNATCLGFLAAMELAANFIAAGRGRRVAIVAADLPSRSIDWDDHESAFILGDGAAAAMVEADDEKRRGIEAWGLETYPEGRDYCQIPAGGSNRTPATGFCERDFKFQMKGPEIFRLASKLLPPFLDRLFRGAGLGLGDFDWYIPHQASHLGLKHIIKRLAWPAEKVIDIYAEHGNQASASIPTALDLALRSGRLKAGQRLLLVGTAAGLSIGAMVLRI